MDQQPKHAMTSKMVWTGTAISLMSFATIAVEAWGLLSVEDHSVLAGMFGPEAMAFVGLIMVLLRAITTSPVRWTQPRKPYEGGSWE